MTDISKYKNKKSRFKDKFWEDAGNLVIKSAFDYSQNAFVLTPKQEFRMYSVNKLKRFVFIIFCHLKKFVVHIWYSYS